jgi:hypothetical protein
VVEADSPANPDLEREPATSLSADLTAHRRLMAEDGRIDADGNFSNGRSVTLNWHGN